MLLAGAVLSANNFRACRVMISASIRAVRKLGCENIDILDEFQKMGITSVVSFINKQESIQFNGRSIFEILEAKFFTLWCGFDKYM